MQEQWYDRAKQKVEEDKEKKAAEKMQRHNELPCNLSKGHDHCYARFTYSGSLTVAACSITYAHCSTCLLNWATRKQSSGSAVKAISWMHGVAWLWRIANTERYLST